MTFKVTLGKIIFLLAGLGFCFVLHEYLYYINTTVAAQYGESPEEIMHRIDGLTILDAVVACAYIVAAILTLTDN